ncbi:MAG: sn-glycerol-3-phosphate import ATP-binding protein UgpC [Burkholderiaceae bacterium]|jgi:sn-glycerol 3-phosphate transport system ATP-binding protein
MATLTLSKVVKRYGKTEVVHGISVAVAHGEFIVMVGPSGCGKSTLLRMVAGLEEISGGEVHIGERLVNDLEPKDRDIAMVFQNYALYPHMSVYDNMAYGLKIRKESREAIQAKVGEAARILELEALLKRTPRQLSGGQRQRVAMGRAIVREPAVFLFDEPLSNLDAKLRVQMRLEIQKLHRRLGTTSLYVTHDQVEAMTLGHRLLVMNAGRAEQIGTPDTVYRKPATTFVAGFIGSPPMNLISGAVDGSGRSFVCKAASREASSTLDLFESRGDLAGRELTLGVRPEHLKLDSSGWPVRIEMVESLGAELLVHGLLGDDSIVIRCAAGAPVAVDETIHVRPDVNSLHWFDAETGLRLD